MADRPLDPPLRIIPHHDKSISTTKASDQIQSFLQDFHTRAMSAQETYPTVMVQLQKLHDALEAEKSVKR
ncbi:hypothetical protein DL96DRAFT_371713 [Flagelloscypha sp. PMI_526]|nr:hypothetical protein DL96DRAFT_371713 [Flagelloscypha sp. PMI_526]